MTDPEKPALPLHARRRAPPAKALPSQVLRSFRIVFNAVRQHFRELERSTGVAGAQAWALSEIARVPGTGIKALCLAMDIRQSTASNLVRALAERGLVVLRRGETDRRTVRLEVTAAGKALLERVPGPHSGILPAALQRLDPATLARLDHDLHELVTLLEADTRAGQIPLADL